jgi:pyridinium-3,5-biscarboxylic acid mononucleotide sulfurtransferase
MSETPEERFEQLKARLAGLESVLVAYSGGVDSTLLAFTATLVLGDRCLCALAVSDTYPESEAAHARQVAAELGLTILELETNELVDPAFRANGPDRCYHCKSELFSLLRTVADSRGLAWVADGSNMDDLGDHRPGRQAAAEFNVVSPLLDSGLTKRDIRTLARDLGLPNWDRPSMACLASRFPYGEAIDEDRLALVARAEDALRELGLRQFRVRAHGSVARLEVDPAEQEAAWAMRERVADAIRTAGFAYVAQDLDGYRSGSLNETLARTEACVESD